MVPLQFFAHDPVNEFYKKECQEKSSPSTGGEISFSTSSPLTVSAPRFRGGVLLWCVCPSCGFIFWW